LIVAGTPTAMQPSGTSHSTTAFAPIATSSPTVMSPSSLAPAPMSTRFPMRGEPRRLRWRSPTVTPWRTTQSSPKTASPLITMAPVCSMVKPRPMTASQGISTPSTESAKNLSSL
jgi:hypothetical protein